MKLRLLDVGGFAARADGLDQVGLAGEEGRGLEDVADLRGGADLLGIMNVGEQRQAGLCTDLLQDAQAVVEAGAAEGGVGAAVRLVERALEDDQQAEPVGDRAEAFGDAEHQRFGFDHAGARDHEQRLVEADLASQ